MLLNTFWSWTARTWLDWKNKGLFGFIWVTFQLLVKSSYINVLSALKWQASLNLSLNSEIKVDSVKNKSFEVILPHRMDLNAIGAIWANLNKLRVLFLVSKQFLFVEIRKNNWYFMRSSRDSDFMTQLFFLDR